MSTSLSGGKCTLSLKHYSKYPKVASAAGSQNGSTGVFTPAPTVGRVAGPQMLELEDIGLEYMKILGKWNPSTQQELYSTSAVQQSSTRVARISLHTTHSSVTSMYSEWHGIDHFVNRHPTPGVPGGLCALELS
jgi:hypothetical protein